MTVDDIKRISVVGSGTMGSQIAQQFALHGYDVVLNDISDDLLEKALASNRAILSRRVDKGTMTSEEMEAALSRVKAERDLEKAAADADFVIEAVSERLAIKREVFGKLDDVCLPHTILASNSSSIVISMIAEGIRRKDKACNMHFFHPALVMKLVEVVKGQWTSEETAEITCELCRRIDRMPIKINKEISSFIVNRILHRLSQEAYWLADNGYATPQGIDTAVKLALGHPMGPFELADLIGLDIVYDARMQRFTETGETRDKPAQVLADLVKAGHLGRKTGKGFYEYPRQIE
ncbi:MAG: 3-hydroxyacyl-CoA dehydrogenase family protein [Chloroflexota bacterium]|nr:MAG: 3-hydroxyacyl-CoA dehydrogenase family protein [Chloroflexota bacterium]